IITARPPLCFGYRDRAEVEATIRRGSPIEDHSRQRAATASDLENLADAIAFKLHDDGFEEGKIDRLLDRHVVFGIGTVQLIVEMDVFLAANRLFDNGTLRSVQPQI